MFTTVLPANMMFQLKFTDFMYHSLSLSLVHNVSVIMLVCVVCELQASQRELGFTL